MLAQMAMSVPYMKEAHASTGSSELFVTIPKSHALAQMTIYIPFMREAKALASLNQQI